MTGLVVESARVHYGKAMALADGALGVRPGELVALVGPNGAGKSTLLKYAVGALRGRAGSVSMDGRDLQGLSSVQRVAAGVVLVPQGRQLFPRLTVRENLQVVCDSMSLDAGAIDGALDRFPILRERSSSLAGVLSGGEQQMLALARGLMCEPRVLLLDEPALGLSPSMVTQLMTTVVGLVEEGVGVVIAEPSIASLPPAVQGGSVLVRGRTVARAGSAEELADRYRDAMGLSEAL